MKISIITPVYNREKDIIRAIQSVRNLKIPKNVEYEHIIINDGSSDKTEININKNKLKNTKYISLSSNQGVNVARNEGIKNSSGEYILFFDSDDELEKDAIIKIKKALDKTNKQFKVYKFFVKNSKNDKLMSKAKKPYQNITYKNHLSGKYLSGEFISLVHKTVFEKIMFDKDLFCFESFFWNIVSKTFNSEVAINEIIRIYHDENTDRLSKQLISKKKYLKRAEDYEQYITFFKKDYLKFNLNSQLSQFYITAAIYNKLGGKNKKAKKLFSKAIKCNNSLKILILYILQPLGKLPYEIIMKIYRRITI